jgi:hypothetical protein
MKENKTGVAECNQLTREEQMMENQITCPHCRRTITNNPVVDSAQREKTILRAQSTSFASAVKGSHFGQSQLNYES